MKKTTSYQTVGSIYPGQYVPLLKEEIREALKHTADTDNPFLNVTLTELQNSFKVEVAIPGVERDEFRVQSDDNILSICVLHKKPFIPEAENFPPNQCNYECFERNILLPENADIDFISAEYKAGMLCIHVPKTREPVKNLHTEIIVY
jgi:HSP20 family protein